MPSHPLLRTSRSVLAGLALVLAGLAFAAATHSAGATEQSKPRTEQRLVVRCDAKVSDAQCDAGLCLTIDGKFRGTPVGAGAYTGSVKLRVAEAFPNGEGGACAPFKGTFVLGAGTADRLVLSVDGDSCQDGAGDPTTTSFTGLAQFTVKYGTGIYAGSTGSGLAVFAEDVADNERMTLVGRIKS
jgi:hypothetical protein